MRGWFALGIALLTGTFGTGCPETYGKNGYLDDAMHRDVLEGMGRLCEDGKPGIKYCDDQEETKNCRWECP